MPVTTGVNNLSVVHKASNGISIVFPDVCKTPGPGGPIPIPYPNTATTALKSQQKRLGIASKDVTLKTSNFAASTGNEAGTGKAMTSAAMLEKAQLQGSLNQANARLLALTTRDPNEWQKVLTEYNVLVSALYRTLHPDD